MQHLIRKQTVQLRLNNQQAAFRTQHMVSEHYWHDVVPVLEKVFDEASTENETLHIDMLEIDLGVITEKEIYRQTWSIEILTLISQQLREKLPGVLIGAKQTGSLQPKSIGIGQQWLFYMQNGYLPWNTLQVNEVWKKQVLEALSTDYGMVTQLRNLISTNTDAVTRIVEQHDISFLVQITEILTSRKHQNLSRLLHELEILYQALLKSVSPMRAMPKSDIGKLFWREILELSAAVESSIGEEILIQSMLEKYFVWLYKPQVLKTEIASKLLQLLPIIRSWEQKSRSSNKEASTENLTEITGIQKDKVVTTDENPNLEKEGIFVQHAGMVLLHPFLSMFFNRLLLTKSGKFKNLKTQQKALYLLHYLCTGSPTAEEHELVMPKVLCGYPLQKPVKRSIHLTRKEKEEAEHVLEELIRQWERLKSTSPTGLREGFLQRNGKLLTKNDTLFIQVEASTIDILLDHLPWNLSIIKLPWMKNLIQVEWR